MEDFPAEPGTVCEFCDSPAARKHRVMKRIKGNRARAKHWSGLNIYACPVHSKKAKRLAEEGVVNR